ncbi:MAG: hypothetical protein LLG01_14590 [Planctomycetaceae bacterium]|nr:hypothetical protein [Planctomycetaceae bacterium]
MPRSRRTTFDHHRGLHPLLRQVAWWKTALFMTINAAAFAAVCAFQQYLASGRWINVGAAAYLQDVKKPIGQILLHPLPVLQYPWMILITGLLLAILVFLPVIIAVLYHLRFAAIFIVIQALVSHTPVLAGFSAIGCLLAARTRLRSDMPFVAALLGLLPAVVYLHLMGYLGLNTATVMSLQRWVLYAPFLVATVAAVLACGLVLTLANLTGFRPGVVWPVLLAMTAAPTTFFYTQVGADELDYRMLVDRLPPGDAMLETRKLDEWIAASNAQGLSGQTLTNHIGADLKTQRARIFDRCKRFLELHPASPRCPEVLWVQAQGMSLQIDRRALAGGLIVYTSTWPMATSQVNYNQLVQDFAPTRQAALARLQLAQLAMRSGDAHVAIEQLLVAERGLSSALNSIQRRTSDADIFVPKAAVPSTTYLADRLFCAQRLIAVMKEGGVVTPRGKSKWQINPQAAAALAAYLEVEPLSPGYAQAMRDLAQAHAASSLGPFLRLQAAKAALVQPGQAPAGMLRSAQDLQTLASPRPLDYLSAEANYALGQLYGRLPAGAQAKGSQREYYQAVAHGPVDFWARMADDALASMAPDEPPAAAWRDERFQPASGPATRAASASAPASRPASAAATSSQAP